MVSRGSYPVYFDTPFLIIWFSGIDKLICHGEIEFNRVYFLRLCTKYVTRFSKYRIELIVAYCLRQMPQKVSRKFKRYC